MVNIGTDASNTSEISHSSDGEFFSACLPRSANSEGVAISATVLR